MAANYDYPAPSAPRGYSPQRERASVAPSINQNHYHQPAAGERIYGGQVININQYNLKSEDVQGAGKGILVPIKQDGGVAGFSTLSLYRYRAAVRKQRQGDEKGKRIREKTFQNMNKMDKKHNRLMNGVSVAHAAR